MTDIGIVCWRRIDIGLIKMNRLKVEDEAGRVHKISASAGSLGSVRQAVAERTGIPSDAVRLTYKDELGDTIILAR